jgi:xanthine/CO dehydrogenase XdhC/CoxF family maturation factor
VKQRPRLPGSVWVAWADGSDRETLDAEAIVEMALSLAVEAGADPETRCEVVDNRAALAEVLREGAWCAGALRIVFRRPRTRAPAEAGFARAAEDACLARGLPVVAIEAGSVETACARAALVILRGRPG